MRDGGRREEEDVSSQSRVGERKINFEIGAEESLCIARCLLIITDWHGQQIS